MDELGIFVTLGGMACLAVAPTVLVVVAETRRPPGAAPWRTRTLALVGPLVAAWALLLALWLPRFEGRCGGWLGETRPCTFAGFASEAFAVAGLTLAVPGLVGSVLGALALGLTVGIRRLRG
jgi:hypothetical protein